MAFLVGAMGSTLLTLRTFRTDSASDRLPGRKDTIVAERAWSEALVTAPCLKPAASSLSATRLARPATGVPFRTATVVEPLENAAPVRRDVALPPPLAAAEAAGAAPEVLESSPPLMSCTAPKARRAMARSARPVRRGTTQAGREGPLPAAAGDEGTVPPSGPGPGRWDPTAA